MPTFRPVRSSFAAIWLIPIPSKHALVGSTPCSWYGKVRTRFSEVVDRLVRNVKRVVFVSNQTVREDRDEQDYAISALHVRIERAIASSGVDWTFLRPGAFASNARAWWMKQVRPGDVVRWPFARAHSALIHETEIAAVAGRALLKSDHHGQKYVLIGPASLTLGEQVHILGEALGRRLKFEEMPSDAAHRELSAVVSEPIVTMLLAAWRDRVDKPEIATATLTGQTERPPRSSHHLLPFGQTDQQAGSAPAPLSPTAALKKASISPALWVLAGSFFICGASTSGLIGTHLIPACHDYGISELHAAGLLVIGVFDILGITLSGWLTDRFESRYLLLAYYLSRGISLLFLPHTLAHDQGHLRWFAILYGLDWVATVPPTVKLATDCFGRRMPA